MKLQNGVLLPETYSEPCQKSKMKLFVKVVKSFQTLTFFHKKLHPRCLTGFWIHIWLQVFLPEFCEVFLKNFLLKVRTYGSFSVKCSAIDDAIKKLLTFTQIYVQIANTFSVIIFIIIIIILIIIIIIIIIISFYSFCTGSS